MGDFICEKKSFIWLNVQIYKQLTYSFIQTPNLNNYTPDCWKKEENLVLSSSRALYHVTDKFPQADLSHSRSSNDTFLFIYLYLSGKIFHCISISIFNYIYVTVTKKR